VWNPKPYYHFKDLPPQTAHYINIYMIAFLINYYDQETEMGLSETEISGNDFLLTKDFKIDDPQTVKKSLKLIAARSRIKVPFKTYLNMIREEFLK
jgi:hypothetical protein